jgi:hypothetical protein
MAKDCRQRDAGSGPVLLTLAWPIKADRTLWSPYYRVDLTARYARTDPTLLLGYDLTVNQSWHQALWNLDLEFVTVNHDVDPDHFDPKTTEYNAPYAIAPRLDEVLIVGAGSGNDVAGALRAGADHVVAVEIDPLILRLGEELHPENPYTSSTQVELVNQDARSFFRRDKGSYDLIVFSRLDSPTLFSTASSVRLDNFVYTRESLDEARALLADDGLMAMSFWVSDQVEWIGLRHYRTLNDVFGHPPQVYQLPTGHVLFLIKRNPVTEPLLDDPRVYPRSDYTYREDIAPVTDDWPYLYLRERTVPTPYLITLIGAVLFGTVLIRRALLDFRQIEAHFFFMGAAFFLLYKFRLFWREMGSREGYSLP